MTRPEQIVEEARSWIGTRFVHQASLKGVGVDCVGLLVGVAYNLGIIDARAHMRPAPFKAYGRLPNPDLLDRACIEYLEPAPIELGGVLLMRFERDPQHFAIVSCMEPRRIIHAFLQARAVVENGVDELWSSRIVRSYRFK